MPKRKEFAPEESKPVVDDILLITGAVSPAGWEKFLYDTATKLGIPSLRAPYSDNLVAQLPSNIQHRLIVIDTIHFSDRDKIAPLISSLRQKFPHSAIVAAFASSSWEEARIFFLAGASDYVRQTVSPPDLFKVFIESGFQINKH